MTRTHSDHGFMSDLATEIASACRGRWGSMALQGVTLAALIYVLWIMVAMI